LGRSSPLSRHGNLYLLFFLARIAKSPSHGIPYPILVFAAMLPWQFFSNSLSEAGNSLIVNTNLISKVYFPRLIIPLGALTTSLVDLLISVALLVCCRFGSVSFPTGN
jgi:lipopolysaccharide transport system permease protein